MGTIDRNRKIVFGRFLNIKKDIIETAKNPKEIYARMLPDFMPIKSIVAKIKTPASLRKPTINFANIFGEMYPNPAYLPNIYQNYKNF